MVTQRRITQSMESATLADLLERILDKGIVIAGDIAIKLVEVELLTVQIRLVICSVDKAKEMGMDWWVNNPAFGSHARHLLDGDRLGEIETRLVALETRFPRALGAEVPPGHDMSFIDSSNPSPSPSVAVANQPVEARGNNRT